MINKELVRMYMRRHFILSFSVAIGSGVLSLFLTLLFPDTHLQDAAKISMSWPKIMKDLFGDPILGFTDIYGWLNLQIFHITYWAIFGIFASLLASYIIAKEVEGKTIDILLSCSITRADVIISRILGLSVILTLSILPLFFGCLLGILILDQPLQLDALIAACFTGLVLFLVCAGTTLFISTFIPYQIPSLIATWALFGFLFLYQELFTKLVPGLDRLSFISPFHFYRTGDILIHRTFIWSDPVVLLCVFVVLSSLSVIHFMRRDILL